ncbi:hypothetical protein EV06_0419 [Prochlorococcus sp. MIT 0602]|nr:hypothetical protein EV06_0419 [Prochlorococcus sp. MIT 0602]
MPAFAAPSNGCHFLNCIRSDASSKNDQQSKTGLKSGRPLLDIKNP